MYTGVFPSFVTTNTNGNKTMGWSRSWLASEKLPRLKCMFPILHIWKKFDRINYFACNHLCFLLIWQIPIYFLSEDALQKSRNKEWLFTKCLKILHTKLYKLWHGSQCWMLNQTHDHFIFLFFLFSLFLVWTETCLDWEMAKKKNLYCLTKLTNLLE